MANPPNLSLPPRAPELGVYRDKNWDDASFAMYTLIDISNDELQEICDIPDKQWMENQGGEGSHLVRVAPQHNFAGKTLKDILDYHVQLDRTDSPDGEEKYELDWYPTAFVVLTSQDWKSDGLLFVYADDEAEGCPLDKFFFLPKDSYMMLSSVAFGDETCTRSKEVYQHGASDISAE
ncbi:hypothetical protein B0A49_00098 [Cryomyces minteri]|uniref:Uncharacterized protein n=1 Tax=Cryomyces minteri TaxID=331657 RepID=A0A4U0XZE0_9PEZI|nr:hypothetical protein B0A49_00098 [Cryomyces minteri]